MQAEAEAEVILLQAAVVEQAVVEQVEATVEMLRELMDQMELQILAEAAAAEQLMKVVVVTVDLEL